MKMRGKMKTKRKVKAITPARPGQARQSAARSVSAASRQPVGSQSGPSKPQFAATAAHDSAGAERKPNLARVCPLRVCLLRVRVRVLPALGLGLGFGLGFRWAPFFRVLGFRV